MAEVLVQFETVVTAPDGRRFVPSACGREAGTTWEGWIEFTPAEAGAAPLRTPRETVQPNRADLLYWAEGLTQVFLEGALARALGGPVAVAREAPRPAYFDGPASPDRPTTAPVEAPRAVLDPFATYAQGEDVLLGQLGALSEGRLRDIVGAYGFADAPRADGAGRETLVALILSGVRRPRG